MQSLGWFFGPLHVEIALFAHNTFFYLSFQDQDAKNHRFLTFHCTSEC